MLSWFHTTSGGWNHGMDAGAGPGVGRTCPGDGAWMDAVPHRGGTTPQASLCPPRSPAPRLGLYPRLAEPRGAQKRLAVGGSQRGCGALWGAAFVGVWGALGKLF